MLQDSDTTTEHRFARRGLDGLAQIGPSKFDLLGLRFIVDNEGSDGAGVDDSVDDEAEDEATDDTEDTDADEQDSDDDGFEGEFDAKRAKALITKLRGQLKAKDAPKENADTPKLQGENLRLRVALRAGLDEDLADRLRGNTEDELLADAEKLVGRLSSAGKLEDRTPKVRLRGGTSADKEPETTPTDVVSAALGR